VIIDTHCHLNFNSYIDDLPEVLQRAKEAGIARIVVPAIDLETSREVVALSKSHPEIYAAVGIHPNEAGNFKSDDINTLRSLANEEKVIAIGEIGLDNFHKEVTIEDQIIAFKFQLELAGELSLPVLIHNRETDTELLDCLTAWINQLAISKSPLISNPGIMHAFSSSTDFAKKAISMKFAIGAAGLVTFKNAVATQNVFQSIPPEYVVIETDAPFLTPHPYRGKRNEPAYCVLITKKLAELWQLPEEKVAAITTNNASRIFRWKEMTQIQQ
jgi:TatD DNase family protein